MSTLGGILVRGALLAGVLAVQACAEYRISVPDSDPIQLEGQESEYVERSMNAYLWATSSIRRSWRRIARGKASTTWSSPEPGSRT